MFTSYEGNNSIELQEKFGGIFSRQEPYFHNSNSGFIKSQT